MRTRLILIGYFHASRILSCCCRLQIFIWILYPNCIKNVWVYGLNSLPQLHNLKELYKSCLRVFCEIRIPSYFSCVIIKLFFFLILFIKNFLFSWTQYNVNRIIENASKIFLNIFWKQLDYLQNDFKFLVYSWKTRFQEDSYRRRFDDF